MATYQTAIASASTVNMSSQDREKLEVLEGQLSWLVYVIGSVVGGHSWSTSHLDDGEETIDAGLSRRVFQCVQLVDFRCCQTRGAGRCRVSLESAFLFYFQNFRRVYMFMWEVRGLEGTAHLARRRLFNIRNVSTLARRRAAVERVG